LDILLDAQAPRVPLVHGTLPLRDELRTDGHLLCHLHLVKQARILVLAYIAFLLFRQQRRWAWAPQELLEAVQEAFLNFLATEIPYRVPVLDLQALFFSICEGRLLQRAKHVRCVCKCLRQWRDTTRSGLT
jgi:hypothetical protein